MIEAIIQCVRGFLGDVSEFWNTKREKLLNKDKNAADELCCMEKVQMLEVSDFLRCSYFQKC